MNPRKSEFVLSLIAGITGIIAGITGIAGGGLLAALSGNEELSNVASMTTADSETLAAVGGLTVFFSVIALVIGIALIVFAVLIKRNAKVFGILTLIAGVVGFFLVGLLWIVPGILAIIAGIMCLARKVPASLN
ncbi:DUF4064 domain-containing protein [Listeria cossartiae subsp. cayugensis]|uniref:DUF4064 domain-containing protein n=1 Tax=Listeria cossartiae TaxID=2838249 RepID=UPI00288067DB|nr:DUF4064 domain-containing protein [Listeria cossartiae]MDT0002391.1 DUF4064 domain-containing protein [Listeria cossartiae subsp. cayugensis]MDT0019241.1 DUF4064 domain-containing protein [Listeria cossartiae subsp. cayugensis]MDT0035186.1 DUF4064 domain-containing protein [Listeria cossartiae subsp. cayugensis]MDT0040991.1 DUF4064 domain-containing protein [Listeria cossartiae subsp. cayugensis]MDT0045888.1 DUF4064 domain-containing protein [Listeria cossartiae subsp. cayugensis]